MNKIRLIDKDELLEKWDKLSLRGRVEFDQVILNEPIYNINTLVDELIDNCFEIHSGNYNSDRCLELDDVLEILNKYFNLEEK